MKLLKFPFNYRNLTILIFSLILLTTLSNTNTTIPPLSQIIMQRIFNNNQVVVIYICQNTNPQTFQHFSDYCVDHSCAYLDVNLFDLSKKNNPLHQNIRDFVGHQDQEYFVILDAPRQLKYVLQVKDKQIKYKDIYNFEAAFTSQTLEPFFSSEAQPTQVFQPCRKLVGKNLDSFLALQAPIKIVYLYTEQQSCEVCGQMLRGFADIAEKLYREDVIAFGYFDIFKNDHPKIPSQVAPYFLVFKEGEDEPYGIEGEKFHQLENALINIIAQHIYPEYKNLKNNQGEVISDDLLQHTLQNVQELQISSRQQPIGTNYEL